MNDAYPIIMASKLVTDLARSIWAPIIDKDDFEIAICLPRDALDAGDDKLLASVDRDDNTYEFAIDKSHALNLTKSESGVQANLRSLALRATASRAPRDS
jgi:hypothetical protein